MINGVLRSGVAIAVGISMLIGYSFNVRDARACQDRKATTYPETYVGISETCSNSTTKEASGSGHGPLAGGAGEIYGSGTNLVGCWKAYSEIDAHGSREGQYSCGDKYASNGSYSTSRYSDGGCQASLFGATMTCKQLTHAVSTKPDWDTDTCEN